MSNTKYLPICLRCGSIRVVTLGKVYFEPSYNQVNDDITVNIVYHRMYNDWVEEFMEFDEVWCTNCIDGQIIVVEGNKEDIVKLLRMSNEERLVNVIKMILNDKLKVYMYGTQRVYDREGGKVMVIEYLCTECKDVIKKLIEYDKEVAVILSQELI